MSKIISEESPLLRLPVGMDPRQRIILDGMRYSVEMAELSHSRLKESLLEISKAEAEKQFIPKKMFPSLFLDAWSIVDSINRLRTLLTMLTEAKKPKEFQNFILATNKVQTLRNNVQHLKERIDRLVSRKEQAWGYISWITFDKYPKGRMHTVVAGSLPGKTYFSHDSPAGKPIKVPIDYIKLHAHEISISLLPIMDEVKALALYLEQCLSKQFANLPRSPSDPYIVLHFVGTSS